MKIVTVVGARPQFIKASVVSAALKGMAEEVLVHTGQHYDKYMSDVFFEELSIPHPKYNLGRITARNLLRMMEDPDWQKKNYAHQFPVSFNNGNSVRDIR